MPYVTEETITKIAQDRWGTAHSPRMRELYTALIKHLHDFAREVHLTEDEWFNAVQFLMKTGQMSSDARNEFILLSDVLGLSMLVVQMNHRLDPKATPNTVLGPFYQDGSPELPNAGDMGKNVVGDALYITGKVRGLDGEPVGGAKLDIWQADEQGLYEVQRPDLNEPYLRGVYHTQADGSYCIRSVSALGYPIPMDGTAGEIIRGTDISYYRPAHVHFIIEAPGYKRLVTHIFRKDAPYLETDVVYGVKKELITEFKEVKSGPTPDGGHSDKPFTLVNFDFTLESEAAKAAAA